MKKVEKINKKISPIQDEYIEKYLAEKELDLVATQYFDCSAVESIIKLVQSVKPDAWMIIKSIIPVGYTEKVRTKFGGEKILFSPEFLRESKELYDNVYPKFSVDFS